MVYLFLSLMAPFGPSPQDDDTAIEAMMAATPSGGELHLEPGRTYLVRRPISLIRPIAINGRGATIRAAEHAGINAVLRGSGTSKITISRLTIDANADHGGADYGVWITGGTGHRVEDVAVRDTAQACIAVEDAVVTVNRNRLDSCGRAFNAARGSATNNHGIMIFALASSVSGVRIENNTITNAYRKGITTYVRASGTMDDLLIKGNIVSGSGLGGIYISGAPGSHPQSKITVEGNSIKNSYVGFEFDNVNDLVAIENQVKGTRGRSGTAGGDGFILHKVTGARLERISISDSGGAGFSIEKSRDVRVLAPHVLRPNAGGRGFGPGIRLLDTSDSSVEAAVVKDDRPKPLMTHGLIEQGASRNNILTTAQIAGATASAVVRAH